jgi:hypothetical protein
VSVDKRNPIAGTIAFIQGSIPTIKYKYNAIDK